MFKWLLSDYRVWIGKSDIWSPFIAFFYLKIKFYNLSDDLLPTIFRLNFWDDNMYHQLKSLYWCCYCECWRSFQILFFSSTGRCLELVDWTENYLPGEYLNQIVPLIYWETYFIGGDLKKGNIFLLGLQMLVGSSFIFWSWRLNCGMVMLFRCLVPWKFRH